MLIIGSPPNVSFGIRSIFSFVNGGSSPFFGTCGASATVGAFGFSSDLSFLAAILDESLPVSTCFGSCSVNLGLGCSIVLDNSSTDCFCDLFPFKVLSGACFGCDSIDFGISSTFTLSRLARVLVSEIMFKLLSLELQFSCTLLKKKYNQIIQFCFVCTKINSYRLFLKSNLKVIIP